MNKKTLAILLIAVCIVIAIVPLMTIKDSEFGGADGEAEDLIGEINPDYEPWAESLIEPPGGETESLLFSLQAGLGGLVLGGGFGYLVGKNKRDESQTA